VDLIGIEPMMVVAWPSDVPLPASNQCRRHDVVWGSELRVTADHFSGVPLLRPNDYKNDLVEGFAQDEWALVPGRLKLTLGTKVQTGTLAGFQVLSSARLLFSTSRTQTMWAGASQAAVAPSLQDKYSQFPLILGITDGLPIDDTFVGGRSILCLPSVHGRCRQRSF
jgi:iron complex outermembrane recepter protein